VAATVTTPLQLPGWKLAALALLLPAAITTIEPAALMALIAFWYEVPQDPEPPKLRLRTFAGLVFVGTPLTVNPVAQRMPSTMSEVKPPQRPNTRTGTMGETQLMPATPKPLLLAAPMVPATCVPCQLLFSAG
jgi:hypothetical protein